MIHALYIILFTSFLMLVSCSSEATTLKAAGRAYAPIGDLMFLAMREDMAFANVGIKNRVPDSKVLYDVENFVVEGGFSSQVRVEVREQVVVLRGSASSVDSDTLVQGIEQIFGVRYVVNALVVR